METSGTYVHMLDKLPFVAGVGFVNGLFHLLTIKTISIGSIHPILAITVQFIYRQA